MESTEETVVVKEALPLYLEGKGEKAVLIIHGYTGYAGEFYPLAYTLNDLGYTVHLPRLPGHGTHREDFRRTGWKDWLRHTEECYRDLRARFDDVSIVGLSMGGVLALILSSRYNPRRTVCLAPAMAVRNKLFYLTPVLRYFVGPVKTSWEAQPDDSDDRRHLGYEYWTVDIPAQAAQLRKLQKIAKKALPKIQSPLLLMLSERDESVPPSAEKVIRNGLYDDFPVKTVILKNSHHVLVTGEDKDRVTECTVKWLEEAE